MLGILGADALALCPATADATSLFLASFAIAAAQLVAALCLPLLRSPRFLLARDRDSEEARDVCRALYDLTDAQADDECALIAGADARQKSDSVGGALDGGGLDGGGGRRPRAVSLVTVPPPGLLSDPAYRYLFGSLLCLHVVQQLCGINAVFYYSTSFLQGVVDDPAVGTALVGVVNVREPRARRTVPSDARPLSNPRARAGARDARGLARDGRHGPAAPARALVRRHAALDARHPRRDARRGRARVGARRRALVSAPPPPRARARSAMFLF